MKLGAVHTGNSGHYLWTKGLQPCKPALSIKQGLALTKSWAFTKTNGVTSKDHFVGRNGTLNTRQVVELPQRPWECVNPNAWKSHEGFAQNVDD